MNATILNTTLCRSAKNAFLTLLFATVFIVGGATLASAQCPAHGYAEYPGPTATYGSSFSAPSYYSGYAAYQPYYGYGNNNGGYGSGFGAYGYYGGYGVFGGGGSPNSYGGFGDGVYLPYESGGSGGFGYGGYGSY